MNRSKAARRAWWASLSAQQQAAYIERKQAAKAARPNAAAAEASARLDLATERGALMTGIPDADVAGRIAQNAAAEPANRRTS